MRRKCPLDEPGLAGATWFSRLRRASRLILRPAARRVGLPAGLGLCAVMVQGQSARAQGLLESGDALYYGFLLFLGVAIAVPHGSWLVFTGLRARRRAAASRDWPTAAGRVTESRVVRSRSIWTYMLVTRFVPAVTYEYAVGDKRHVGRTVEFGLVSLWRADEAETLVSAYPVGASVTVHHDPARPDLACLSTSAAAADSRFREGWLTFPLMFLPAAIMYAYHALIPG